MTKPRSWRPVTDELVSRYSLENPKRPFKPTGGKRDRLVKLSLATTQHYHETVKYAKQHPGKFLSGQMPQRGINSKGEYVELE